MGPLKYLVNSPEMHVWHHVHPDAGPPDRNFGITLSLWDWIFGTAYLPEGALPNGLGSLESNLTPETSSVSQLPPSGGGQPNEANRCRNAHTLVGGRTPGYDARYSRSGRPRGMVYTWQPTDVLDH